MPLVADIVQVLSFRVYFCHVCSSTLETETGAGFLAALRDMFGICATSQNGDALGNVDVQPRLGKHMLKNI